MKTTKYFTIYSILILTHGLSQSVTRNQNLMPPMPFDGTEELEHLPLTKYDNSASDSRYDDFLSNIIVNSNSRDGEVVYTFTTCGQSGQFGPSQNQANAAYSGSNISVTVNNGIQEWTVPVTGNYVIEAYGARGGDGSQYAVGDYGEGAYVKGTFTLNAGDKLQILIGQEGSYDIRYGGGGGGGSFVAQGTSYGNATPLIIAGGGGGGGYNSASYVDGQAGTSGSNGGNAPYYNYGGPGIGGSNGSGATGFTYGGNAGGFYSNGSGNYNNFSELGVGFRNGGNGGNGQYGGRGGFGGGAGGYGGAGGGGGYSGGGGGAWHQGGAGGGGGSYNNGLDQSNLEGTNITHGLVVITSSDVLTNTAPTTTAQTLTGNEDETQTITLIGSDADGDVLTYNLESGPSHGTAIQDYSSLLSFDGVNDEIMISGGNFISGNESRSISVWADGFYGNIVSLGHGWTSNARFSILINQRRVYIIGQWNDWATNYYLPENQMTHLVVTHDGNTLKLYADGVLQQQTSKSYNTNANMPIMIGTNTDDRNDEYFNGTIDDVIITRDVITSNEVTSIYNGNNITLDNLVGMYDFNEGSGNVVYDLSMNMNDGNITGTNWINEGTANIITYTPNPNYNGTDSFTFSVSDGIDQSVENGIITINVLPVNDLPNIISTPALNINEGQLYEYPIALHDMDGDQLSLSVPTKPDWLDLNDGSLSGTPNFNNGGLHDIIIMVNDGNGGIVSQEYAISVSVRHLEITGESGFRILSSPISGPIFGDLLEELWTQGSEGSDHEGADPNVWTFDNEWVPVTDLYNDNLGAGEGFVIYVFSDTDYDGNDDLPVTIGVDGTISESSISVNSNANDWNLVGNPYGLHVNINQLLSDNNSTFHSTVYRMDDVNPGYRTHNGVVGDIDQGLIKPFDGFWIQAGPEGHLFEFTENCMQKGHMVHNGGARTTSNESTGSAVFTFTSGQYTSSVYLSFTTDGNVNLDPADAKRIIPMSPEEHLTSMIRESNKSLSINNLPFTLTDDISFELDAMYLTPGEEGYETQSEQVSLTWDIMDLPVGISLSLVNNMNGQAVNLYGFPSANVSLPSKGGFEFPDGIMQTYPFVGDAQFTLSVSSDLASSLEDELIIPDEITLHNAYPNPFNPSTMISFDINDMSHVSLNIFDLTGRQVASLVNETLVSGYHQISWNPGLLPSGVYLVELISNDKSFNQKITYIK